MMDPTTRHTHGVCRVLIVEDDPSIASLIADALEGEIGVTTTTLHDGADAIHFLERQQVEMVVLDYELPGANGIQVCDAMQQYPHLAKVPVLFVTANAERADFQSRSLRCIHKPFDLVDLLDTVETCLNQGHTDYLSLVRPRI